MAKLRYNNYIVIYILISNIFLKKIKMIDESNSGYYTGIHASYICIMLTITAYSTKIQQVV